MVDYAYTDIDGGSATLDGKNVVLGITTTTEALRLMVPADQIPRVVATLLDLYTSASAAMAEVNDQQISNPAFEVHAAQLKARKSDRSHVYLELALEPQSHGLTFRISRQLLRHLSTEFLNNEGQI